MDPAPGTLHVVQAFLNTRDRLRDVDELASPRALNDWLRRWGLTGQDLDLSTADLEQTRTVREALRALVRATHGKGHNEIAAGQVDRVAAEIPLHVRFAADGTARFEGATDGLAGAIGQMLAHVAQAQVAGTWARLKLCPGKDCSRVFYDGSGGLRKRWCAMSVCGSRSKWKTYRNRHPDRIIKDPLR